MPSPTQWHNFVDLQGEETRRPSLFFFPLKTREPGEPEKNLRFRCRRSRIRWLERTGYVLDTARAPPMVERHEYVLNRPGGAQCIFVMPCMTTIVFVVGANTTVVTEEASALMREWHNIVETQGESAGRRAKWIVVAGALGAVIGSLLGAFIGWTIALSDARVCACVYGCFYACMYACVRVLACLYVWMYSCRFPCLRLCRLRCSLCVCVRASLCVRINMCLCPCVFVHVCTYIFMYTYIYIYIYEYVFICVHIHLYV